MDIFPTQYSTLSAKALNAKLQQAYGLRDTVCRLLIRNVSDTYILENTSSKYIFKIYRDAHRTLEEIKGELALLNTLKDKGCSVSFPVSDLEGQQIQRFQAAEGVRYGVLFSFAEGEVVYEMNDYHLALVGVEMAKVHNLTAGLDLPFYRKEYNIQTTLLDPVEIIKPAFSRLSAEYEYLKNTVNDVVTAMNELNLKQFSYGYCHYDFLPKNFHFEGDHKLTFFDFDFVGKGYLVNDLASFLVHYFLENVAGKISIVEVRRCFAVFIAHYRKVRPVTDDELHAIKYFGFAFWIFYFRFHYENFDDWSNIFFNEKFIKGRVGLIKQWVEWEMWLPFLK